MDPSATFTPYSHQVGGHTTTDGLASAYTDGQGRFYKPLQPGPRAQRELSFYESIQAARRRQQQGGVAAAAAAAAAVPPPAPAPAASVVQRSQVDEECRMTSTSGRIEASLALEPSRLTPRVARDLVGLAPHVPRFYGTSRYNDHVMLVLEDLCASYSQPCVCDIKVGFRTWYTWAEDSYIKKCRQKDDGTTQGALGFRVCGMQVYDCASGCVTKRDRQWGKRLAGATDVASALAAFCDNGALTARDVLLGEAGGGGGGGALAQLRALRDWFSGQGSLQFFASSVLLVYEGAARSAAEARTAVRFVDFAHVFLASGSSGDGSDAADRRLSAAVPPGECPALAAGGSSQQQHVTVQAALTGCSAMPSPAVGDSNCLRGLDSLIATLQRVAEGANYTSAITSTT